MMRELPEKFPEYSIMYKTLSNEIRVLEKRIQIEMKEIKSKYKIIK